MEGFFAIILVAALTFAVCFGADKLFTKLFRSKQEQKSGLAVRVNKKYGAFGTILLAMGVGALLTGTKLMLLVGIVVIPVGIWMVAYYLGFGVYYDTESFVVTAIGKKSVTHFYKDICSQQLYYASGNIIVELQMADGSTVQVNSNMEGVYAFLDYAFSAWCEQRGIAPESCGFHDPANSCWFPTREV